MNAKRAVASEGVEGAMASRDCKNVYTTTLLYPICVDYHDSQAMALQLGAYANRVTVLQGTATLTTRTKDITSAPSHRLKVASMSQCGLLRASV